MSVYHWLVVLVVLLALLMHGEKKRNTKYILLVIALMFCVYGLRDAYTIGVDSASSYLHMFQRMEDKEWDDLPTVKDWFSNDGDESMDKDRNFAFRWLMKLVYDWTEGDYQWFVAIVAAFVMIAVAQFVRRYSPSPVQSFLYYFGLLYYTQMFGILKQSIAMAFILFAFNAIMDRKLIRFLILTLVASMFHFPALVFLPAYWIANMRLGRTYLVFLAVLFVVTYFYRDQLLDWMTDAYDTVIEDTGRRFLANKVIVIIVIIVAALVIRPPSAEDRIYNSLLMILGVAAVIQTFSSYNNTFERLADYYFQFSIVFIPMVFEDVKLKRRHMSQRELTLIRRVGPYLFCAFAIWRFLNYVQNPDALLTPYQFYFQAEKAAEDLLAWRFL